MNKTSIKDQSMDNHKHPRTLSSEPSSEPSFRILYYGENGAAVPFKWESQPGTPKNDFYSDYIADPPLTPPPSFLARKPDPKKNRHHHCRRLKMSVRRSSHVSPTSSYPDSTMSVYPKARNPRSLMVALMDTDEEEEEEEENQRRRSGGRLQSFKNALVSVLGCQCKSFSH